MIDYNCKNRFSLCLYSTKIRITYRVKFCLGWRVIYMAYYGRYTYKKQTWLLYYTVRIERLLSFDTICQRHTIINSCYTSYPDDLQISNIRKSVKEKSLVVGVIARIPYSVYWIVKRVEYYIRYTKLIIFSWRVLEKIHKCIINKSQFSTISIL